ncbi:NADPH cytochrome P450 oxidoreductase family protein [Thalassotalea sediminis]|uniref:NADPH cytochrome P450 oxidoreductase family protein n=1 Tax=Thalassotalea sediminis TaxID=1759089 RepID=UPI0025731467|nr:NADPH cytochrome P450 oxidoreductase family protein [Thalassotalea sediminis]
MTEELRIGISLALGITWCMWVIIQWLRHRPTSTKAGRKPMVVYASQTGQAQAKAQKKLTSFTDALCIPLNKLTAHHFSTATEMHFFLSTYGDGEAPDNGRGFEKALRHINHDILQSLAFTVTALGDSRYPRFCAFGKHVYQQLTQRGAQAIRPITCIDANTENAQSNQTHATLIERTLLNPDSESPGLYLLKLKADGLQWQPGDLLEVSPPIANDINQFAAPRTYSIASAASSALASSLISLIVRLHIKADQHYGLASGFLTQQCQLGDNLKVTVRENPACQLKTTNNPLLLIGAGSGLAGLLGHIEQRTLCNNPGSIWLIYGERDPVNDQHLSTQLTTWQHQGVLSDLDRVYSRQISTIKYVQDVLLCNADKVKRYIEEQGDIYVCGSLARMGQAVNQALIDILGQNVVDELLASGRYHRDLY